MSKNLGLSLFLTLDLCSIALTCSLPVFRPARGVTDLQITSVFKRLNCLWSGTFAIFSYCEGLPFTLIPLCSKQRYRHSLDKKVTPSYDNALICLPTPAWAGGGQVPRLRTSNLSVLRSYRFNDIGRRGNPQEHHLERVLPKAPRIWACNFIVW